MDINDILFYENMNRVQPKYMIGCKVQIAPNFSEKYPLYVDKELTVSFAHINGQVIHYNLIDEESNYLPEYFEEYELEFCLN